eukprot:CAMPEP_0194364560 /NCGR_PEP_ID=MMETSP0174-20130528/12450_1 /TAXON_ID=216777 /ORGANISM="Proboscia alata, Strain PI-D3" /LENGTH=667 /DNA_ID=CAMNT_0039138639 /DNA_START=261 /DNA_END=2264 /DNA_ORIENTATION=+
MARTRRIITNPTPHWTAQRRVGQLLQDLFGDDDDFNGNQQMQQNVSELLGIFREFPDLILQEYGVVLYNWRECCGEEMGGRIVVDGEPTNWDYTPLHLFLYADVGLHPIQALFDLVDDATDNILEVECLSRLPIHVACRCSSEEIILFLAKKRPDLLKERSEEDELPFACAVNNTRHALSVKTMQWLLQQHPQAVRGRYRNSFSALASRCGARMLPLDLFDYMVDLYLDLQKQEEEPPTELFFAKDGLELHMDLQRTKILGRLLQQQSLTLTALTVAAKGWHSEAFIWMMKYLEQNKALDFVCISLPLPSLSNSSSSSNTDSSVEVEALSQALKQNNTLQRLHLSFSSKDTVSLRSWLDAVKSFCCNNQHGEDVGLVLKNVSFSWDPAEYRYTGLYKLTLDGYYYNYLSSDHNRWVFNLKTHSSNFSEAYFVESIEHILSIFGHNLASLEFAKPGRQNSERESILRIHSLLQQALTAFTPTATAAVPDNHSCNQPLEPLTVSIVGFQYPAVVEGSHGEGLLSLFRSLFRRPDCQSKLKSFTLKNQGQQTIQQYNVKGVLEECLIMLKEHNITLQECAPFGYQDVRIQYFLDLNRLGRKAVRNITCKSTLVDLLVKAQHDSALTTADSNTCNHDSLNSASANYLRYHRVLGIMYGLLREAPGLWTETT